MDLEAEYLNLIEEAVKTKTANAAFLKSLESHLNNPKSSIRLKEYSAWAIGELNHRDGVKSLVKAANHKGLLVRAAGLEALMHMRARTGLKTYIHIANNDPTLILRQRATIALGLLRWEKTINALVTLSEDPKKEIRGAAALSMGATQSEKNSFIEILEEIRSEDKSPYVQLRALRALRVAQRKNSTVRTHLDSPDPDIRLMAALYFHYHGTKHDIQALKNRLPNESDPEAQYEIEQALLGIEKRIKREKERAEKIRKEKERREKERKEKARKEAERKKLEAQKSKATTSTAPPKN